MFEWKCVQCRQPSDKRYNLRFDQAFKKWVVTHPTAVGIYCLDCAGKMADRYNRK